MHLPTLFSAGLASLGLAALLLFGANQPSTPSAAAVANGHLVLVVEGDRDQLAISHCQRKPDPWAGTAVGLRSDYELAIFGHDGAELARFPLDLSKFDLDPASKGKPARSVGCIVMDSHVAMLVNAPDFGAAAAQYSLLREGLPIGGLDGQKLRQLQEGRR